jgi:hypothetical protein
LGKIESVFHDNFKLKFLFFKNRSRNIWKWAVAEKGFGVDGNNSDAIILRPTSHVGISSVT